MTTDGREGAPKEPGAPLVAVALAMLALTFPLVAGPRVDTLVCDGSVYQFQIPDDYRGGGCTHLIPEWHAAFPWNWGRIELECLGLCTELLQ
jgi:hypothetical protein